MKLSLIQASVQAALPLGLGKVSSNRREFFSKHFVVNERGEYYEAEKSSIRYYAQVYVLGDRRPYDVEIVVHKQKRMRSRRRSSSVFKTVGTHRGIANEILVIIKEELSKRSEGRNIIDDFRIF